MEFLEEQLSEAIAAGDLDRATALVESRDRSIEADPVVVDQEALLTLAAMGFELEACNVALAVYKDLETSMEMLLSAGAPDCVNVGGVDYAVDLGRGARADRLAAAALAAGLREAADRGDLRTVQWTLKVAAAHPELRCEIEVGTGWGPVRCHLAIADTPASDAKLAAAIGASKTPIMLAAQKQHFDVVAALAEHKANVDILDTYGNRPLHFAVSTGDLRMIKLLIGQGASLERPNKLSFTPLHVAVQNDQFEAASMLLHRKADPLAQTNTLSSSLHLAARQGSQQSVELLLTHRAAPDTPGLNGITPLRMALQQGHGDVVDVLLEGGASLTGALLQAVESGSATLVSQLLERGADPQERDGDGRTALHFAVTRSDIAQVLLGARTPMTPDVCGRTPLHEVATRGSAEVARLLLASKADVAFQDSDGRTALELARRELEQVWSHEGSEGKSTEWFEWAHDQFGVSMANAAKNRDLHALVKVLEQHAA